MLTLARRLELVRIHADSEAAADIETTLSTMEPNPVYTLFPVGKMFTGMANTRRYYEILVAEVLPRVQEYTLLNEWHNDHSVAQEYTIRVKHDEGIKHHRVVTIFEFGETAILGERQYTDDVFARLLAGSMWDKLEPTR